MLEHPGQFNRINSVKHSTSYQRYEKGLNKRIGPYREVEIKRQQNESSISDQAKPVTKNWYQRFKTLLKRNVRQMMSPLLVEHSVDPSLEEKIAALHQAGIMVKLVPKAFIGIGGTASGATHLYEIEVSVNVAFDLLNQAKKKKCRIED